jgi:hypothetical protein
VEGSWNFWKGRKEEGWDEVMREDIWLRLGMASLGCWAWCYGNGWKCMRKGGGWNGRVRGKLS